MPVIILRYPSALTNYGLCPEDYDNAYEIVNEIRHGHLIHRMYILHLTNIG